MSETELSVVCKSCGAEVSPYVTECPYCGARLRKRAPELERRDGTLEPKLTRRERRRERRRKARESNRAQAGSYIASVNARSWSWAAGILVAVPVAALIVRIAIGWTPTDLGAVTVPSGGDWWRFLAAPFVYGSIGYAFVVGLALVIFVPGLERRLGTIATVLMLVACGVLGMLAAYGVDSARGAVSVISGGNGIALGAIAAWYFTARPEARSTGQPLDLAGVGVCAAVILLLPLVVDGAGVWAGVAGGLVGTVSGLVAGRAGK